MNPSTPVSSHQPDCATKRRRSHHWPSATKKRGDAR